MGIRHKEAPGASKIQRMSKLSHKSMGKAYAKALAVAKAVPSVDTVKAVVEKKKRDVDLEALAEKKICKLQERCDLIMQHAPFSRYVKHVGREIIPDMRFSSDATKVFQFGSEALLTAIAADAAQMHALNDQMLLCGDTLDLAAGIRGV